MSIVFHPEAQEFHLFNDQVSCVLEVMANGHIGNLYYGKRIADVPSFAYLHEDRDRPLTAINAPWPSAFSLNYLRQDYPAFGTTDYRYPAYKIRRENGSEIMDFKYVSHSISAGKPSMAPLPATYVEHDSAADSLAIELFDAVTATRLILHYTMFADLPVLARHTEFIQEGEESLCLEQAMSLNLDLPDADYEWVHLYGAWARERHIRVSPLAEGLQSIYSMRGTSSAEHNPFIALKRPAADETSGEVIAASLVYSGNFLGQVEVSTDRETRLQLGIHPNNFRWNLAKGNSFVTPEAVLVYSDQGLGGMSHAFHDLWNNYLVRGEYKNTPRPILLNNWEATFMNFTEADILRIASKTAEAGAELFVLDDGWFGKRDDDFAGLGDWKVNLKKLPNGIKGLSEKVEAMGMKFGLWIEPEMVNEDSDLFREHPDYVLTDPERFASPSRHQYILDFSRKEVVDNIHAQVSAVIRDAKISYIKWDMNRYLSEVYSRGTDAGQQGEVLHRYILGVYDLYDRLTTEFPDILFESCSSGGARFDPGLLYYAPQAWCSDDTDAAERMRIQYGTSLVYPNSSIGAHVSAVPNDQVGRTTPLQTRANVAFFGAFGYELDLNHLPADEFAAVKEQIVFYKEWREVCQFGTFHRLINPFGGNDMAWISVAKDQKRAILGYYQILGLPNPRLLRVYPRGLCQDAVYEVRNQASGAVLRLPGSVIEHAGLPIDRDLLRELGGDFASLLLTFTEVD